MFFSCLGSGPVILFLLRATLAPLFRTPDPKKPPYELSRGRGFALFFFFFFFFFWGGGKINVYMTG